MDKKFLLRLARRHEKLRIRRKKKRDIAKRYTKHFRCRGSSKHGKFDAKPVSRNFFNAMIGMLALRSLRQKKI